MSRVTTGPNRVVPVPLALPVQNPVAVLAGLEAQGQSTTGHGAVVAERARLTSARCRKHDQGCCVRRMEPVALIRVCLTDRILAWSQIQLVGDHVDIAARAVMDNDAELRVIALTGAVNDASERDGVGAAGLDVPELK